MANTRSKKKEIAPADEVIEKVDTTTPPAKSKKRAGEMAHAEGYANGTVICQNLNVRKEPALGATILKIIPKDTIVTVLEPASDTWYKVRVGEIETGFCMKEFIKIGI